MMPTEERRGGEVDVPLWEMSIEELRAAMSAKAAAERVLLETLISKQGARGLVVGADGYGPTSAEIGEFIRALDALDYSSARALGDSLKYAFIRLGGCLDPRGMRVAGQRGFAQVRAAAFYAAEKGFDWREVLEAAREGIYGLYDDPGYAREMSKALTSLLESEGEGRCYYEATKGSSSAALAP